MARSNADRLKEAIDKGDIELARQLVAKIEKQKPRRKPKAKANRKREAVPATTPDRAPGPEKGLLVLPGTPEYYRNVAEGVTTARKPSGVIRGVQGRRVSMAGRENINIFDDWMKEGGRGAGELDGRLKKMDLEISKNNYQTPRPGMPGSLRTVAQKEEYRCICGRVDMKYPTEVMMVDSDGLYRCDRCIVGRR